jgi:DNA-directed RNA polymerase-3 subunit RPC5
MATQAEEDLVSAPAHDVTEVNDDAISDISDDPEVEEEEDDDPVINEFDVFITPKARELLLLFQYVGRHKSQPFVGSQAPIEMRVKPESSYFEMDVPINIYENYDRVKGVRFGEAMRKTKGLGQTAYGEAGGFDRKMPKSIRRPNANADDADPVDAPPPALADDDNLDDYVMNFEDANEKGHVLNKLTWGGKLYRQPNWKPNYMVGTFRGGEFELTAAFAYFVDSFCSGTPSLCA